MPLEWLLGRGYGAGYLRVVMGSLEDFSPHDFYVQLLLRIGFVGVLTFVLLYLASAVRFMLRAGLQGNSGLIARIFVVLIAANLVYFIPYQGDYPHGALLGVALGVLAAMPRGRTATAGPRERAAVSRGSIVAPVRREPRLGLAAGNNSAWTGSR